MTIVDTAAGISKEYTERQWRDKELARVDGLISLPDYPYNLHPYRDELRNYPARPDFPNGARPVPPEQLPKKIISIVIISAKVGDQEQSDDYRIKQAAKSTTAFQIELRGQDGQVLPVGTADEPEHFALPVTGLFGQRGRTVGAQFVAGKAEVAITWPESGEWEITERALNWHLTNSPMRYRFPGLIVSVFE